MHALRRLNRHAELKRFVRPPPPPPPPSPSPTAPPGQPKSSTQGLPGSTSEPEVFQALDEYGEFYEIFWGNAEEVEALVETAPQPITVPETSGSAIVGKEPPRGLDYAVIKEITGDVRVQIEGQKNWQKASVGMKIWNGSLIQTDFDATVIIDFESIAVVKVEELTQVAINKFIKEFSPAKARMDLEIHLGDMNLDVNPGKFSADVQVRPGNHTAGGVRGTNFRVAYDPNAGVSTWEIYDGTILVSNDTKGETVAMSSKYGEPIKRLEVSDDGAFTPKIAIPKDEWEARKKQSQVETVGDKNGFNVAGIAVILAVIVFVVLAIFFFTRKVARK